MKTIFDRESVDDSWGATCPLPVTGSDEKNLLIVKNDRQSIREPEDTQKMYMRLQRDV